MLFQKQKILFKVANCFKKKKKKEGHQETLANIKKTEQAQVVIIIFFFKKRIQFFFFFCIGSSKKFHAELRRWLLLRTELDCGRRNKILLVPRFGEVLPLDGRLLSGEWLLYLRGLIGG